VSNTLFENKDCASCAHRCVPRAFIAVKRLGQDGSKKNSFTLKSLRTSNTILSERRFVLPCREPGKVQNDECLHCHEHRWADLLLAKYIWTYAQKRQHLCPIKRTLNSREIFCTAFILRYLPSSDSVKDASYKQIPRVRAQTTVYALSTKVAGDIRFPTCLTLHKKISEDFRTRTLSGVS